MSASKRLKTIRARENYTSDIQGVRSSHQRRRAKIVKLTETSNDLRFSRIRRGGPIRSTGLPAPIAAEHSRQVSPRVIRNAAIKEARDFSRSERKRIRDAKAAALTD
jgi:hypothetical protein